MMLWQATRHGLVLGGGRYLTRTSDMNHMLHRVVVYWSWDLSLWSGICCDGEQSE